MEKKQYPRYFIGNKSRWEFTKYVYIEKPNGPVYSILLKNNRFSDISSSYSEMSVDMQITNGNWKEVSAAELVLII